MDRLFRNKNILVIVFEMLVIVLGIIGITYATSKLISSRATTLLSTTEYKVDYVGKTDVIANGLEPISDSLITYDSTDKVIRLEFSLRGVSTNKNEKDLIYDIMLKDMNIDCSLLNKYTKWNLYKNGKLLSNGSFDPSFDGNVLSDNMRLTNIQENLPKHNDEYDKYVLIIWVSETCNDLEKCELIDQSNIINSKMSMKVFVALYSGAKKTFERVPNYDTSCANKPELFDNMIAITYDNGEWVTANINNSSNDLKWYDYGNAKWANAAIVKNGSKYSNVKEGTKINTEDVLGYYVWIPRYKYKTWNVEDDIKDTYDAYNKGIDIVFENWIIDTMTNCENDNCTFNNNQYITHPVFGNNLKGLWISKYEMSKSDELKFVPGVMAYQKASLDLYKTEISGLNEEYKIGNKANIQIVSNLAWGVTVYLSHSKYGVCRDGECNSLGMNNSYILGSNKQDTTTRNVYGVYDMAGASSEYAITNEIIGTATKEVMIPGNMVWYKAYSGVGNAEFALRGGMQNGLFYYSGLSMSNIESSTRTIITSK